MISLGAQLKTILCCFLTSFFEETHIPNQTLKSYLENIWDMITKNYSSFEFGNQSIVDNKDEVVRKL